MVQQRYLGLSNPAGFCDGLRPMRRALMDARLKLTPLSPEYDAVSALLKQLEATADVLTGQAHFFDGGRDPGNFRTGG